MFADVMVPLMNCAVTLVILLAGLVLVGLWSDRKPCAPSACGCARCHFVHRAAQGIRKPTLWAIVYALHIMGWAWLPSIWWRRIKFLREGRLPLPDNR